MDILLQQIINGLIQGSLYAVVALGYTMVYGVLELINFAHGDIVMVGALVTYTVFSFASAHGLGAGPALALAVIAAIAVCAPLGLLIERVAYRPLRRAQRLAPLITAIGVSILVEYAAALIWSKQYLSLPELVKPTEFQIGGATTSDLQVAIVLISVAMMAGLLWLIKYTRIGKAMRATAQSHDLAGLMGVNVDQVIAFTFVLGSALGAVAGVMQILYYGIGHYLMGFMLGLKAFTAAVLGGIGNVQGAMLGGLLLGLIESLASGYIGDLTGGVLGSNYRDVFAFLVLVLVLVLRPSGLMGQKTGDRA
ncbi:MAG TPA: branched-chain amino acid ABC transporter permease [Burkholderiales bacterium]|jgi:branched-chain amino acid transport system permease protein